MGQVGIELRAEGDLLFRKGPLCSNGCVTPKMLPITEIDLCLFSIMATSAPILVFYDT
jgi:hypothetical protein